MTDFEIDTEQDLSFLYWKNVEEIIPNKIVKKFKQTDWVLPTSGTTGSPKFVTHTLNSLTKSTWKNSNNIESNTVWGLFYELNRFAGLQVLFQALSAVIYTYHNTVS